MTQHFSRTMIIIAGPTAVGKSDVGLALASRINGEIVNADVGQLYTPLTIGTAKPDWKSSAIPHHLFDILDSPIDCTVTQYREVVIKAVDEIWDRAHIPIIVGGSHFYLASLFFPPPTKPTIKPLVSEMPDDPNKLWELLQTIDPQRAKAIHPNDTYRIKRALEIWFQTGQKPSTYIPIYDPPAPYTFIICTRERSALYQRINERTDYMIDHGWLEEVERLMCTPWQPFLMRKKIIGYDDIILYLEKKLDISKQELIDRIAQKTRNYAKRQLIFLKMLQQRLQQHIDKQTQKSGRIIELNLTESAIELYIKRIVNELN